MKEKLRNTAENEESSSFGEGPFTIDEVVDKIYKGTNIRLILVFITASATATQIPMQIYVTIFAGFIPYTQWKCISDKCQDSLEKSDDSKEFYTSASMCDNKLVAGEDFEWTSERTSFSMD